VRSESAIGSVALYFDIRMTERKFYSKKLISADERLPAWPEGLFSVLDNFSDNVSGYKKELRKYREEDLRKTIRLLFKVETIDVD